MMDVKDCLSLPEEESLACVKEAIKTEKGVCPSRLVLLLEGDCEPCIQARREYEQDIKQETIQVVSTASKEGKDIIKRNNIEYAPALLLLDCNNQLIGV